MKNKYRILKIIFTIGVLLFLLNFSLERFSNQPLEKVKIQMVQNEPVSFIDEKDILSLVKQVNPHQKIGTLDIPILEKKISEMPVVDSVNVYLKLNGELNLDIMQRIPTFRLEKLGKTFYVDEKGVSFPLSKNYSHPCMLVSGNIDERDYIKVVKLVKNINADEFSRDFFVGIKKIGQDYFLMTNDGNYEVEIGDLENMKFKIKGFKTFVEKYLIYQSPEKYSKISLKYNNQIVTTLRKGVQTEVENNAK
jgi:hypothetical protein